MGREAAVRLGAPVAAIGEALVRHAVAHADETGMCVAGGLLWLHVLCTATLSFCAIHSKRGRDAVAAISLLASLRGILVHDHWAAYGAYDCQHAFCNAHHLCELVAMAETYPELPWPKRLIALLCEASEASEATGMARTAGLRALPGPTAEAFFDRYDALLAEGARCHPRRTGPAGRRGLVTQTTAYNLIGRPCDHRQEVLRFLTVLRVPFDNHQARRDARSALAQAAKVSGCLRSENGAHAFATIRSYLLTSCKQSVDPYQALAMTFRGNPPMPRLG
jgi:transposase